MAHQNRLKMLRILKIMHLFYTYRSTFNRKYKFKYHENLIMDYLSGKMFYFNVIISLYLTLALFKTKSYTKMLNDIRHR